MYLRFDDQSWTNPGNTLPVGDDARFRGDTVRPWNVAASSEPHAQPRADEEKPPGPLLPLRSLPAIQLHGVRIHAVTEAQTVEHIAACWRAGKGGVVVTPNLDHLRRCGSDMHFAALLDEADVIVADGMPLVWASRLQGTPLPQRVAGSNLIWSLSQAAATEGKSIFLLGGAPGAAEAAAVVLRERFHGLNIVGTCCPENGFENSASAINAIITELKSLRPDVVYVALGSPKQEKLIARLRPILPRTWWLGIGISLSFVCGTVRRAPLWMQRAGLEWVHRLAQEPRRLFKRYILSGLPFAASLLTESFMRGIPIRFGRRSASLATAPAQGMAAELLNYTPITDSGNVDTPLGSTGPQLGRPDVTPAQPAVPTLSKVPGRAESLRRRADELLTLALAPKAGRIRALVLLGGSVRQTPLSLATGRSVLDLPLDSRGSVLSGWLREASEFAAAAGLDRLPVRLTVNHIAAAPTSVEPGQGIASSLRIEPDASEYRGTGGVLHDVAIGYHDDDFIIVANAAQVLLDPLRDLVAALQTESADVTLIAHDDGTPTGLMLVRCAALRLIAHDGFVDMKEQALPRIALQYDVRVLYRNRPSGLPLRTLEDYILALRCHHRRASMVGEDVNAPEGASSLDPLAEDWTPAFSMVEPGAVVDPTVRVHDSVVLAGSTIEPGAVLVRSVICPGGIVRRDKAAVDRFVTRQTGRQQRRAGRRRPSPNATVGSQA